MNRPPQPKQGTTLWLALLAVLAVGGFLVTRQNLGEDSAAPLPRRLQPARGTAGPGNARSVTTLAESVHRTSQPADHPPGATQSPAFDPRKCGYEMPFPETNAVPLSTVPAETDPLKLCAALAAAQAGGTNPDIAALRAALLDSGTAAVPGLSSLLNAGLPATEIEAVRLLVQIGGDKALAFALGKMLTVPATSPAYAGFLAAFADCRSTAVAAWFTDFLGKTQSEEVRQRVLAILVALRGPEVVQSLAAQLMRPADPMHAEDCAGALAKASDPAQAASLRVLLETGETPAIQVAAAYGLANVGSDEAVACLAENGSSSEAIASTCRDALANVVSSYAQETLIRTAVSPAMPSDVRCSAVQALSTQQGQRVQTTLINLGQATGDPALLAAIGQALRATGPDGTPPPSGGTGANVKMVGETWF